jgi:hypothetical protein
MRGRALVMVAWVALLGSVARADVATEDTAQGLFQKGATAP